MQISEFKANISGLVPKHGRGDKIEVKLDVPFALDTLQELADAMMNNEGGVSVTVAWEPMPLFADDEEDQLELEE